MSRIMAEDIGQVISDENISWEEMRSSVVFITGATGLIGRALVRALSAASDKHGLNLRIISHGRSPAKGEALSESCGVEFICGDIRKPLPASLVSDGVDYIFHCAAVTKSADMAARPAEVIATALDGTWSMLELARSRPSKSVVYLSSMEVYGQTALPEVTESDLGYLDLASPRSCYPESKRMCECMCGAWFAQYGVPVKIARLAQTFGAGTPSDDPRVFAQFARSAAAGKNIILHTDGNSQGNYCYISDAVRGLLLLLLRGENGEAYNISNPHASMTVRQMAALVADKVFGGNIAVVVDKPSDIQKYGYAPNVTSRLNVEKLERIGWKAIHGLEDMYRRMISDWRENTGTQ